ncbi:hypothetical protein [Streptomyces sp. RFCAC02]|uniref:hypothetical protein n=1 Tax=Streptomyces sp. RFCAC02 TaxID=2499143 RepID=UPI00143D7897|nr:hypothetical protein [Streptomyces sp. RFCAC02]
MATTAPLPPPAPSWMPLLQVLYVPPRPTITGLPGPLTPSPPPDASDGQDTDESEAGA